MTGGGCGRGRAQKGGLGERCKLPQWGLHGAKPRPAALTFPYLLLAKT